MEMKIMWAGCALLGGWLAYYLFGRQLMFNFLTALRLIRAMQGVSADLISPNAKRYLGVSAVVTGLVFAGIAVLILIFCPLYLKICFFVGLLVCVFMFIRALTPDNRDMFDSFCTTYYRFVPDDELRTAMYNKKPSQMKLRLHDMGLPVTWIPEFRKGK